MLKSNLFIFAIILALSPLIALAEDINIRLQSDPNYDLRQQIGSMTPFGTQMQQARQQNLQNELMHKQIESLSLQNQSQQIQQMPQMQQLPDQRMQLFAEAADRIDIECQGKRERGEYKTFLATNQQCTTPKVIGLAEQMAIPNMDFIYQIMQYSESLARRVDNKEITEQEAYQLLNNYNAN